MCIYIYIYIHKYINIHTAKHTCASPTTSGSRPRRRAPSVGIPQSQGVNTNDSNNKDNDNNDKDNE